MPIISERFSVWWKNDGLNKNKIKYIEVIISLPCQQYPFPTLNRLKCQFIKLYNKQIVCMADLCLLFSPH